MSKTGKDPCKPFACAIQACLTENNFQEYRCSEVLERMRLCCVKWHKESLCCSGINLEKSYLQNPKVEINPEVSRSKK
ncbi:cx9C motif-containing protein 4 isoform X2 [Drosophila hydei]|uniref:Cx9C motif-containing protein 4 isoform X2 n=1 Tax=Drosophila hydei TaxID=7224 RepID=A0A6J1LTF9_DROHY|nr:cx9C motif-containing protein 4 isoform X2 [Drosophila hydei]